jgi:hypothetical protein
VIFLLGGDSLRKANKNPDPPAELAAPIMRRAVMITRLEASASLTPQRRCRGGRELSGSRSFCRSLVMFNFSRNHLADRIRFLRRVGHVGPRYPTRIPPARLHQTPAPHADRPHGVAGKVNSVHTLYLVIESVKLDTKHERLSTAPVPADGAGGSHMR